MLRLILNPDITPRVTAGLYLWLSVENRTRLTIKTELDILTTVFGPLSDCRAVSCRVVLCRVVLCRVVSCRAVSCRVVPCLIKIRVPMFRLALQ